MLKKLFLMVVLAAICLTACSSPNNLTAGPNSNSALVLPTPPGGSPSPRTTPPNTTGTVNNSPIVPDPKLTPGDTLDVTKEDICTPGYSKKVRDVPQSVKEAAYQEYGITSRQPKEYEVDHLISLELGGSNSLKNLWPESYLTEPWNARVKDTLENKLHEMICSGQIDIHQAQREIATDWISAYQKYIGEPKGGKTTPVTTSNLTVGNKNTTSEKTPVRNSPVTTGKTEGAVVGNRKSHIYHRPGCPDYDKISADNRVEFANAGEAEKAGYRLAKNCP